MVEPGFSVSLEKLVKPFMDSPPCPELLVVLPPDLVEGVGAVGLQEGLLPDGWDLLDVHLTRLEARGH